MPRTIWILWLQGWDAAPYIVRLVLESWRRHCPGWRIVTLDERSLLEHAPLPPSTRGWRWQHRADLARVQLLASFGGVWVDATLLALRPLDAWLWSALAPTGGFMYHGPGAARSQARSRKAPSRYATVWFMAASNTTYIFHAWHRSAAALVERQRGREPTEYYLLDGLFEQLLRRDATFQAEWGRVPFLDCNRPAGGPHAIAGRRALRHLAQPPECLRSQRVMPHVLKLNKAVPPPPEPSANGSRPWLTAAHHAVICSLGHL
jgi:hypothetical protein